MSRLVLPQLAAITCLAVGALGTMGATGVSGLAQANPLLGLNDPTRPPAGLVKAAPGSVGTAAAPEAASAASAPPPPPREPQLVLQLVRIDPFTGRGVALINGQLLEPGARIEGRVLLSLTPHEAVLQGPRGRVRLSLTGEQLSEPNPKSAQSRRGRKE